MNAKTRRAAAVILDVTVILSTLWAVGSFWFTRGSGNMQVAGAKSLRFYTNLSNIYGALGALLALVCGFRSRKDPELT